MKRDIEGIDDIRLFVDSFYSRVRRDELLGPIFDEHITDWGTHLQIMYRFWNAVLFGVREYAGNPLMKHVKLAVRASHFERWLDLFYETLDKHFEGPTVQDAKNRARIMAHSMYNRINERMSSLKL